MRPEWGATRTLAAFVLAALVLSIAPSLGATEDPGTGPTSDPETSLRLRVNPLPDGVRRVRLIRDGADGHWYILEFDGGGTERVRPDEFTARLERDHRGRAFLYRLFNITSPVGFAWVAMGLLGQVLFAGRMVLQWLVSESARRSVVPVGFWWMSLAGASMLLAYFVWRRDIVGVLGQSVGWTIYARNLWLIFRERRSPGER
jgi:lipid-A-disaccharide synthase-like uncharacterized protein